MRYSAFLRLVSGYVSISLMSTHRMMITGAVIILSRERAIFFLISSGGRESASRSSSNSLAIASASFILADGSLITANLQG